MALSTGKNIRLFENPLLEKLTFVHPLMPIAVWGPIIGYSFACGILSGTLSIASSFALFFAGLLVWTLSEYLLHRFIFHFDPKTPLQHRLWYLFHGIHHDDPNDQRRLLMPPAAAILIASVFFAVFSTLLGLTRVNPFFAGFLAGYLCYDYIHFATHFAKIQSPVFKRLKHNHMKHHFTAQDRLFGVSSPLWDYVFKTKI